MARLPTPGGDENTWGNVLNDFLSAAHNNDGSLKDTAISEALGLAGPANIETTSGSQAKVDTHANNIATPHGYGEGTLAARPSAIGRGFYFATDDNNGTLYRSVGSSWVKAAAPVQSIGMRLLGTANTPSGAFPMGTVTGAGSDAATGVALPGGGCSVTITATGLPVHIRAECWLQRPSTSVFDFGELLVIRNSTLTHSRLITLQNLSSPIPVRLEVPSLSVSAGSHTFELRVRQAPTSGTITTYGGGNMAGFLSVYEVVS